MQPFINDDNVIVSYYFTGVIESFIRLSKSSLDLDLATVTALFISTFLNTKY